MTNSIDIQCRKWNITINNPLAKGLDHDKLKEILSHSKPIQYYCMSDEIGGETNTHHTHIYIHCTSPMRFSTLKNNFPNAHIEQAHGTTSQNRDYIFKQGKWEKDKKHETNLADTHEESGELPVERPGARNDIVELYDLIKQGLSDFEILDLSPEFMPQVERIDKVRQIINEAKFKNHFRDLDVTYLFGDTGTGKTSSVMNTYGYENVYRITNYTHPFDMYHGQPVIIFEEFRSSLSLSDMLIYLDGYPTPLPCRFYDRIACYTTVYIISNIDLWSQYQTEQLTEPTTWQAFLRRIHTVEVFQGEDKISYPLDRYLRMHSDTSRERKDISHEEQ